MTIKRLDSGQTPNRAVTRFVSLALLALGILCFAGCGSDDNSNNGNEKDTISLGDSDATVKKELPDGRVVDATEPTKPQKEDYAISYITVDQFNNDKRALHLYSTKTDKHQKVNPEGVSCQSGCWVSEDLEYFVYATRNENGVFSVFKAPLDSSFSPNMDNKSNVVSGASRVRLEGNVLNYAKNGSAFIKPLSEGEAKKLGGLSGGQQGDVKAGWVASANQNVGFIFQPDTVGKTLTIKQSSLGGSAQELYTIDSSNYQQISLSAYGGNTTAAISPDGKYLAILTNAPNNYGTCESDSDCSGKGQKCGHKGFCTAWEQTIRFIELAKSDNLGSECGGEGQCGKIHRCYSAKGDYTDGVCIPRRVSFGLGDPQANVCEQTSPGGDHQYTTARGPISFDSQNNAYFVAGRKCRSEHNIEVTNILKVDPESGKKETVFGNSGKDFDPNKCYDREAEQIDVSNCTVYIERAKISPANNELAFIATNPNVTETSLAEQALDLWRVLRNGKKHEWVGREGEQTKYVNSIQVHPLDQ